MSLYHLLRTNGTSHTALSDLFFWPFEPHELSFETNKASLKHQSQCKARTQDTLPTLSSRLSFSFSLISSSPNSRCHCPAPASTFAPTMYLTLGSEVSLPPCLDSHYLPSVSCITCGAQHKVKSLTYKAKEKPFFPLLFAVCS